MNLMDIKQAIAIGEKGVLSIVGAGGKTSFMYSLAHELASAGKKVLTTTTTKIFIPTHEESSVTIVEKSAEKILEKVRPLIGNVNHLTLGTEHLPSSDKLVGVPPGVLNIILEENLFDYILIEADGAARRSLKACSIHEPVVPECTDCIISLAGLDGIGKPLEEKWVFRSNLFSNVTNLPLNEKITATSVAEILIHDMLSITSAKKDVLKIVFLNKADNRELREAGNKVAAVLEEKGQGIFHRLIIGELKEVPVIHQCRVLN